MIGPLTGEGDDDEVQKNHCHFPEKDKWLELRVYSSLRRQAFTTRLGSRQSSGRVLGSEYSTLLCIWLGFHNKSFILNAEIFYLHYLQHTLRVILPSRPAPQPGEGGGAGAPAPRPPYYLRLAVQSGVPTCTQTI